MTIASIKLSSIHRAARGGIKAASIKGPVRGPSGSSDAFLDALKAIAGYIGVWSARDAADIGTDLEDGATPMTDISGNGLDPIECSLASTGDHRIAAGPNADIPSLSKALAVDVYSTSWAAIQSLTGTDPRTIIVVMRVTAEPGGSNKCEFVATGGTIDTKDIGGLYPIIYRHNLSQTRLGRQTMGFESAAVADAGTNWRVVSLREEDANVLPLDISSMGGDLADVGNDDQTGFAFARLQGLRIGGEGGGACTFEIALIALYSGAVSDSDMGTIIDGAVLGE